MKIQKELIDRIETLWEKIPANIGRHQDMRSMEATAYGLDPTSLLYYMCSLLAQIDDKLSQLTPQPVEPPKLGKKK